MKCVFVLLPDDNVHNIFRHKAFEIDNLIHNGFIGSFLPPHISLKQSFVIEDLKNIVEYFDALSSQIAPFMVTFDRYTRWENVIMANVKEQEVLRNIHHRINAELLELCKNPRANHDGDSYHFHLTIAYGGETTEAYEKAYETLCRDGINVTTKVDRLGLLYYQNDDDGAGKFITYKINRLDR